MANAYNTDAKGKIYNALVMIVHMVEIITPNGDWPERLLALKNANPYVSIPETNMGFPTNVQSGKGICKTRTPPQHRPERLLQATPR